MMSAAAAFRFSALLSAFAYFDFEFEFEFRVDFDSDLDFDCECECECDRFSGDASKLSRFAFLDLLSDLFSDLDLFFLELCLGLFSFSDLSLRSLLRLALRNSANDILLSSTTFAAVAVEK